MADLTSLVDEKRNFTEFRNISKSAIPPLVPYPTVYHRDLLSLQSLGDVLLKKGGIMWINVDRINRTGVVIKGVIDCKKAEYDFESDDSFINQLTFKSRRFNLSDAQITSEKLEESQEIQI